MFATAAAVIALVKVVALAVLRSVVGGLTVGPGRRHRAVIIMFAAGDEHAGSAGLFDYSSVTADTVLADVEHGLAAAEQRLAELVGRRPGDVVAVVTTLDDVQADMFALQGRTAFLDLVHPDDRVRAVAMEARAKIAGWESGLLLRDDVANLVASESSVEQTLQSADPEIARLVAHWQRDLRRAGHGLRDDVRVEVRALRSRLADIESVYEGNITADDRGIDVTRADVDGLPDDWFDGLGPSRGPAAEEGARHLSLAWPELFPFLTQGRRRDLRRELLTRWWSRADVTNRPLIEEGLALRRRLADLLGYQSWADYATEVRMTGSAARVSSFIDDLTQSVAAEWDRELSELHRLLIEDEIHRTPDATQRSGPTPEPDDGVCPWDLDYLVRARGERLIGMSPTDLAEYFPVDQVLPAMLDMMGVLFDLDITEIPDASVWHPAVTLYAVADRSTGDRLGYVYMDLISRDGKYSWAQACKLTRPRDLSSGRQVAVSALVTNFSPPQDGRPSLLRHDDLVVLFHEFGHVVHQIVTHTRFFRFAGTNVEKDFVEAPSRLMERWAWDLEVLKSLARHCETGQPPPTGTLERLIATRFNDALAVWMLTTWLSRVDLDMHAAVEAPDLDRLLREGFAIHKMPYPEGTFSLAGIGHWFAGYDAGSYSYQWAEVIGDTMVARLERDGLLDPHAVTAFRVAVLEPGGTYDGDELVERFLGEQAGMQEFLSLRGWKTTPSATQPNLPP